MDSYTLEFNPNGSVSVKNTAIAEAMHSSIGPREEAERLYVKQTRLEERLARPGNSPLVLLDVGLGIAANAIAAIEAKKRVPSSRPLQLISFESDLRGLALALERIESFPFLRGYAEALDALTRHGAWQWQSLGVEWRLIEGDFRDVELASVCPAPVEVVFYDFYSPRTSPELWSRRCFERVFEMMGPDSILSTYTAATSVRSAMLLAGLAVGYGVTTPAKQETTVATKDRALLDRPLDQRWLERFERSEKALPSDWAPRSYAEALGYIRTAPQFKDT